MLLYVYCCICAVVYTLLLVCCCIDGDVDMWLYVNCFMWLVYMMYRCSCADRCGCIDSVVLMVMYTCCSTYCIVYMLMYMCCCVDVVVNIGCRYDAVFMKVYRWWYIYGVGCVLLSYVVVNIGCRYDAVFMKVYRWWWQSGVVYLLLYRCCCMHVVV